MTKVIFFPDFSAFPKALSFFPFEKFTRKKVPVKLHMGEKNNPYFIKPETVRDVVTELLKVHVPIRSFMIRLLRTMGLDTQPLSIRC